MGLGGSTGLSAAPPVTSGERVRTGEAMCEVAPADGESSHSPFGRQGSEMEPLYTAVPTSITPRPVSWRYEPRCHGSPKPPPPTALGEGEGVGRRRRSWWQGAN
eukprot:scaffold6620_cov110-Isochrysis_galbana.AAC.6